MAEGDRVIINNGNLFQSTYGLDGLRMGTIVAEALPVCDVVWDDGVRQNGITRDVSLRRIQEADSEDAALISHVGRFSQLVAYPQLDNAGDQPKSPAAAGVVHSAGIRDDFNGSEEPFVIMSWLDGRAEVLLPMASDDVANSEVWAILHDQPGRHLVGKD